MTTDGSAFRRRPGLVDARASCRGGIRMAERRAPYEPGYRRRRVESVRASRTPGEPARGFGCSAQVIRCRVRQAVARPVRRSPNARGCDGGPCHVGASNFGRPHLAARPCGHRRPPAVRDAASATKRNRPEPVSPPRAAHASPGMTMERRTKDARPRTSPRWWAPAGIEIEYESLPVEGRTTARTTCTRSSRAATKPRIRAGSRSNGALRNRRATART